MRVVNFLLALTDDLDIVSTGRLIALYALFGTVVTMFIPALLFMFLEVQKWC